MISCAEATQRLWDYLDQSLDAADRATLEEHLSRCMTCCGELEFAKELRLFLARAADDAGDADVPADVLRRLRQRLEDLEA
jgi:anti-sigma factor (TIGR02949 family)